MTGKEAPAAPAPGMFALLATLVVAEVSSAFEVSMIYASLPTLRTTFADTIGVGWVITSCLLVSAVAAALGGRLGDLHGRRRALLVALVVCTAGSLTSAFSTDLNGVVVGASLQGASGAILPLCLGLARELLPSSRVAFGIGVIVAAAALGSGFGLFLGGAIVDHFPWNAIFIASGSMAAIGWLLVLLVLPSRARLTARREGVDLLRGILFAPAIAGLLIAVTKIRSWGFIDARTLGLLAASAALLAFWVRHQLRERNPLINVRFFADRKIGLAYFCMAMIALTTMQIAQIMSLFLQQPAWTNAGLALSATASGLLLLPSNWIGLAASPLSGKLAERYGARVPAMFGAVLLISGWTALLIHRESLWLVGTAIGVIGFGFSTVYAALPNLIVEAAPSERTSEACGVAAVMRAMFMAVGAQVVMILMSLDTVSDAATGIPYPTDRAFTFVFSYVIGGCTLCLVGAYLSSRRASVATVVRSRGSEA
jgi:MFS family permease